MVTSTILAPKDIPLEPYANIHQASLLPPTVILKPGKAYQNESREWQGIPAITKTPKGILYAAWYTGGKGEGCGNYVTLIRSEDRGCKWSKPLLAIAHPENHCRTFDEVLWVDPHGRLWLFWAQSCGQFNGRYGVWYIRADKPDVKNPKWSQPARICDGVMMNKPTVLSDDTWMLPVSLWGNCGPQLPEFKGFHSPQAVVTTDFGKTWALRGKAEVPGVVRSFDEHMIVERKDQSLWMLVRTQYGIGESISSDNGRSWSCCSPSGIPGVDSRFFIRRSSTGRLLLVTNNDNEMRRINMTAFVSEDDGRSWLGGLMLDKRERVSYPDGVEYANGRWSIVYDRERNDTVCWNISKRGAGEILLADFTEDEVIAGQLKRGESKLKIVIESLPKRRRKKL